MPATIRPIDSPNQSPRTPSAARRPGRCRSGGRGTSGPAGWRASACGCRRRLGGRRWSRPGGRRRLEAGGDRESEPVAIARGRVVGEGGQDGPRGEQERQAQQAMKPRPSTIAARRGVAAVGSSRPIAWPTRTAAADDRPSGIMKVTLATFSTIWCACQRDRMEPAGQGRRGREDPHFERQLNGRGQAQHDESREHHAIRTERDTRRSGPDPDHAGWRTPRAPPPCSRARESSPSPTPRLPGPAPRWPSIAPSWPSR